MTEYRGEEYTSWKDVEEAIRLMGVTAQTLAKAGETNLADRLEDARSIACNVIWRLEDRYYAEMKRRMEEEENGGRGMKEKVVLIDLRTCDMKLSEVMAFIDRWKAENPGKEIWLDGDAYAIVTEKDEPGELDRKCPLCGRTLELSKGNYLWYLVCPSCGEVHTFCDEPTPEEVREWCAEISDEGLVARMIRECDDKSKIQGVFVKSPEYIAEVMRYIADTFDTESAHGAADDLMVILLRGMGYEDAMDVYEKMDRWYA